MGWISEKLKTLGRIWDIQNMFEPNEIVNLKKNPKVARQVKEKNIFFGLIYIIVIILKIVI